ncbi:MAG TPA: DUF448 domain-containing protein [Synergistaceae bacterium]|jgi:hypothetical protein|nr:DUF448 domain-containing protein [Synergistaceae bacterium]
MLRIVRTPEGEVVIDPSGKLPGRGAYVCLRDECVLAAEKRDALSKALKVSFDHDLYARLLERVRSNSDEEGRAP